MEQIRSVIAVIGGILGGVLGGVDGFLYALIVLMIVDYTSGVLVAIDKKALSSDIGRKGITKKVYILLMVVVGNIVDTYVFKQGYAVRTAVIFFYIANECISVTENAANLGLPVPKKLVEVLVQLKSEEVDVKEDVDMEESEDLKHEK